MLTDLPHAMRPSDLTAEGTEQARRFFDALDALAPEDRAARCYGVADDLGVARHDAFRWVQFVRPGALGAGVDWPYEPVPEPADEEPASQFEVLDNPYKEFVDLSAYTDRGDYDGDLEFEVTAEYSAAPGADALAGRVLEAALLKARADGPVRDDSGDYDPRAPQNVTLSHEESGDIMDGLAAGVLAAGDDVPQVERAADKVHFDEARDAFVLFASPTKPPLVVPAATDEWVRKAYSNWDGYPMKPAMIAERVGMTEAEFSKYRAARGFTRTMSPLAPEAVVATPLDELEAEMVRLKEAALTRRLAERQAKVDAKDAERWRDLQGSVVKEFKDAILSVPTILTPQAPVYRRAEDEGRYRLVLPLNDWQIGAYAAGENLRFGKEYSSEVASKMVDDYIVQLGQYLSRNAGADFGVPYVVLLGDILHGLTGETTHGTKLAKHMREFDWEQMRWAIDMVNRIADAVMAYFGDMKIISLPGNHAGAASQVMGEIMYQRHRGQITQEYLAPANRTAYEMIGNSLFVFDHGASYDSGVHGGKIPRGGAPRDLTVKDMVFARADLVHEARQKGGGVYFVMGDQHHTIDEGANGVEIIKLPALPSGDVYADHNGWHSRPAQGLFLVDEQSGLKHFERFYFDHPALRANP